MIQLQTWNAIKERLEARRAALNEEISTYPGPIAGCDAQFNHLLEQRTSLGAELKRLDTAAGNHSDQSGITQFVTSCPFIAGESVEKQ